jgi:sugar phosphate isomerase/epimerase
VVTGFTGSSIWHACYAFPPTNQAYLQKGFDDFARRFLPILEAFDQADVNFALEVHPTEIAFDIASAHRALEAVKHHRRFGFNYDPSHLGYQGVDYWDFRSIGHGDIRFEDIIVALNDIGYQGPLSIEWEDIRMDRVHGATESCRNVKSYDFTPSRVAFDAAFERDKK